MSEVQSYTPEEPLEARLDKIRAHKSSKLAHQSHLAVILSAVEENLAEQRTEASAAAYFVSFLALMDQAFADNGIANKELANSSVYLLDVVAPYTSAGLLKSKFSPILEKLAQSLTNPDSDAALLRSSIGVLVTILLAQDSATWAQPASQMSPKRAVLGLIALAIDPRPKVRKRAQDAVTKVFMNPPPSPSVEHPAGTLAADAALQSLVSQLNAMKRQSSKKTDADGKSPRIIHSLQLIRAISKANQWPAERVEGLCETLLTISKTSDQYLVVAAFDVFAAIFESFTDEVDESRFVKILDIIIELRPATNDQQLAPVWLAEIAHAGAAYTKIKPWKAFSRLPQLFELVVEFFKGESKNIAISASQCLIALTSQCITPEILLRKNAKKADKVLARLAELVFSLLHVQFHEYWPEVSDLLITMFGSLRWRASPHLINALKVVGSLRGEESFSEGREHSDNVIAAAIRAIGPEEVLEHLPLNLEPGRSTGRAWILPLLRENIQNASLAQFINEFLPLSEQFVQKIAELKNDPESSSDGGVHTKIYETLNEQIWSLLPHYTDLPRDLRTSFDQKFAELLSNTLYKSVELRSVVCFALRLLVESNVAYSQGAVADDVLQIERFPIEEAVANIEYLSENFASKILSVLFNVFSQTAPEHRGYILECINAYLSITGTEDVEATFNKISSLLHNALEEEAKDTTPAATGKGALPSMSATMLDLIVAVTSYLPKSSHNSLLAIFVRVSQMADKPQLQKKVFRAFTRLAETEDGAATIRENIENIENAFIALGDKVTSPARGAKIAALSHIVENLPTDDLHFIPAVLSETVLSTKDVNEKTREAAFELLVQMGKKMQAGGLVKHSKVPEMDSSAPDVEATLDEYFTMVSAGLAGSTPHMISATVTGLSRILFEFRQEISVEMLQELSSTVELFLTSNSREIVKSTLGFVKITVISLPTEIVEPRLKSLIGNLMVWSHEHSSHFRAKVKHIVERLVRRFGYDKVAANFPEEDLKLLTNIRKTKERAKRQAKESKETDEAGAEETKKPKFNSEFDEAIYGSSSEDEGAEPEVELVSRNRRQQKKKNQNDRYIIENEDEPMDLLDRSAMARISSTKPKANGDNLKIKEKNKFSKDADGRILVKEAEEIDDDNLDLKSGIDAYVDAIKNGPVRGQRNKLKYKRSRKHNQDSDDDGEDDEPVNAGAKRTNGHKQGGRPMKNPKRFKSQRKM